MKAVDSRNAKKHMGSNIETYHLVEQYRVDLLDYTFIVYDLSDGDPDDDATVTQRRSALWRLGTAPANGEEYLALGKNIRSYHGWDPSYGDENCLQDQEIEVTKVGDYAVAEFKDAYDKVVAPRVSRPYINGQREEVTEAAQGELFFQAIEKVAEDPEDEEAWAIIKKWRDRQVQHEIGWNG